MTTKDNGGSAYPGPIFTQSGFASGHSMGMSLRDWFAGQIVANVIGGCAAGGINTSAEDAAPMARAAYALADAMIAARGADQ